MDEDNQLLKQMTQRFYQKSFQSAYQIRFCFIMEILKNPIYFSIAFPEYCGIVYWTNENVKLLDRLKRGIDCGTENEWQVQCLKEASSEILDFTTATSTWVRDFLLDMDEEQRQDNIGTYQKTLALTRELATRRLDTLKVSKK